jgi:3D (Asp-Asp-Asp) domain-containing protein
MSALDTNTQNGGTPGLRRALMLVIVLAAAVAVTATGANAASVTSKNWAGYSVVNGYYTSVSASWIQPAATCTSTNTSASFWVGLDGNGSDTVEQIGTRASCVGGVPKYESWVELYPSSLGATTLPIAVRPGDLISASVAAGRSGNVTFNLTDKTTGRSYTTKLRTQSAKFSSAEVIAEEPYVLSGGQITQVPFTNFGTVSFTGASVNGRPIGSYAPLQIDIAQNGVTKAVTSALTGGTDFSVQWLNY